MRNSKGQFIKGCKASPRTQFKQGQHWRKPKPYWNREWLFNEYVINKKSAAEIAESFNIKCSSIYHWLRKLNIPRRDISEARIIKHWGCSGEDNPMFGMRGKKSVNWKGGCTPERQSFYSSIEWKEVLKKVWTRDCGVCYRCKHKFKNIHIHHIVSFAIKTKRADVNNLITLCPDCHHWAHSKKNINKEFIDE